MEKSLLLAVDDDPANLLLLERLISRHLPAVELLTAQCGSEGLEIASQRDLDGILLDVQMPGMSGIEMCRRLKLDPAAANVPVVCITGKECSTAVKVQGLEAGALDFIAKPITNVELVAKIKVMLRIKKSEDGLRALNARLEELVEERSRSLLETERQYRQVFEATTEGLIVMDTEGAIAEANPAACAMYGYSRHELLGMPCKHLVHPDYHAVLDIYLSQLHVNQDFTGEAVNVRKDGSNMHVEVRRTSFTFRSKPHLLNAVRDITKRKKAELALESERKQLLSIFDSVNEVIYVSNLDTHEILYANRHFKEMLGHDPIGKPCYSEFQGRSAPCENCNRETIVKIKGVPYQSNFHNAYLGKDFLVTDRVIQWPDGRDVRFELAIDVTERKKLEKEVLEIADGEKRRIGQNLHDGLLQHLTGVSSLSQVLNKHLNARDDQDSDTAAEITRLLKQAIDQARSMSKLLYPISLEQDGFLSAMTEMIAGMERVFHVRCSFVCEDSVSIEDIDGATHLYRIAQEGINNAIKHGKPSRIFVDIREKNGMITMKVEDDGAGIQKSLTQHEFTSRQITTDGMGLRIMGFRADMIDASLKIQPRKGKGTRLVCTLPASRLKIKDPN